MGELIRPQPKCMAALYNVETIFVCQVRILSACSVEEIVVTTGPFADQIETAAAACQRHNPSLRFIFVPNLQYQTTDYIVSMYLARWESRGCHISCTTSMKLTMRRITAGYHKRYADLTE